MSNPIQNRYDFLILWSAHQSNPNGDPDVGNLPRTDPYTGKALVTDCCLKAKMKHEMMITAAAQSAQRGLKNSYRCYIDGAPIALNDKDREAVAIALKLDSEEATSKDVQAVKAERGATETERVVRDYMCSQFADVRFFGGVMTLFSKLGLGSASVRGPVQISFSESYSPVLVQDVTLTRKNLATRKEMEEKNKNGTFGSKAVISYGLFRTVGSIDATLAVETGFDEEDLSMLKHAMQNMFMHDKSAARPELRVEKIIFFKHDSAYGNAPDYKLFDLVKVQEKTPGVPVSSTNDYIIEIDEAHVPDGVTMEIL